MPQLQSHVGHWYSSWVKSDINTTNLFACDGCDKIVLPFDLYREVYKFDVITQTEAESTAWLKQTNQEEQKS